VAHVSCAQTADFFPVSRLYLYQLVGYSVGQGAGSVVDCENIRNGFGNFYRAMLYAVARCPSVRPSNTRRYSIG